MRAHTRAAVRLRTVPARPGHTCSISSATSATGNRSRVRSRSDTGWNTFQISSARRWSSEESLRPDMPVELRRQCSHSSCGDMMPAWEDARLVGATLAARDWPAEGLCGDGRGAAREGAQQWCGGRWSHAPQRSTVGTGDTCARQRPPHRSPYASMAARAC
eukprot:scaffold5708_cov107-Isochrysis_galbana.AAC.16